MNDRPAGANPLALVAAAGGLVAVIVVNHAGRLAQSLAELAVRPLAVTLAAALVTFAVLFLAARSFVSRRVLRSRSRVFLLPADSFDPPDESVLRFAAGLSRTRRVVRGVLDSPASAARVQLDHDHAGQLRYSVEVPDHARAALRTAAGAYGEVELRGAELAEDEPPRGDDPEPVEVARAELVLGRPSTEPLRSAGLDPDPLAAFARALSAARPDNGERVRVCVDLLPVTPARRRRLRRRLLRQARRRGHAAIGGDSDALADVLDTRRRRGGAPPAELVERRAGQHALTSKLGTPEPLFSIQVLVFASSPAPGRATALLQSLLPAFDAWAGDNHFRVSGMRLPGVAFLGSDLPVRRRRFDRRLATGLFRPSRRRVVTASEIAGLLKPPTAKCAAPNVLRSGGVVPPPPPGLPTFAGQPTLLPLGRVTSERGERMVGVPLADTFFVYTAGRSRFGKTETAIGQFLHLARSGHGCFFLDPHEDALRKIKGYLTEPELRERVVEIDLGAAAGDRQPSWNLLAAAGRPASRVQEQVDAVVDSFASALRWDETNTRALNLTTQSAQALVELARQLPAELAPTIFQIPTLLGDDEWRAAVLPFVSAPTRQFFAERFPRLSPEAITPVTNLIDRLRVAPAVAALLGSPTSSYDVRTAMDRGAIVLACPGSGSARDRLVANFLVYDLLHSAKTRAELPPDRRRPFYVFLDEVQTYDGAASGNLAALLEETAKYGLRALLFNQNPERLASATLNAVTTNRSHLLTTAVAAKAAGLLAREWGGDPPGDVVAGLARYTFLASVTLAGDVSRPFRLHGVPVDELFPDLAVPEAGADLDAAIDSSTDRRPIADTLATLDGHDRRILEHLRESRRRSTAPTRGQGRHGEHTIGGPGQ